MTRPDNTPIGQQAPAMRVSTRLALTFASLTILTAGIIIFSLYLFARAQIRQEVRQRLMDTVAAASLAVDADLHANLIDPQQEDTPEYNQVHQSLMDIYYAVENLAYVYTMRLVEDENGNPQIMFVVDADVGGADDSAGLGEIYTEATPELIAQMISASQSTNPKPWADQEFTTDRWGTFLSGYMPLVTADGRQDAILGINVSVSDVLANEQRFLWIAILIFALISGILFWLSWQIGNRLASPLYNLTEDVRKIALLGTDTASAPAEPYSARPDRISSGDGMHSTGQVRIPPNSAGYEVQQLAQVFNDMSQRVDTLINELEGRVEQRTQELAQRTTYLEAAAQLSRSITTILDLDELMVQAVERIRMRFDLYYVGLFLVDETNTWAELKAGTGQAGQAMIKRGHRIRLGSGMIGWSIINARPRLALAAGEDDVRLSTPELPETRSEAALPLRSRGHVIGALSVQSERPGAFDEQILTVLQIMADQVAITIDNARLFSESQVAIQAERRAYGEIGQQAWHKLLQSDSRTGQAWGYRYTADTSQLPSGSKTGIQATILPLTSAADEAHSAPTDWSPAMRQAAQSGKTVQTGDGGLALPIKVRQQVIGIIQLRRFASAAIPAAGNGDETTAGSRPPDSNAWPPSEIETLEAIVGQISQAIESARLYQETQNRAGREKLVGEVTARMRASLDMEQVLQTAMSEIAERLALPQVQIHLAAPQTKTPAAQEPLDNNSRNEPTRSEPTRP